jgi:uncharacterized protein (TIGR03663 family)
MSERQERLLLVGLLVLVGVGLALRLPGLADRPLHSDESVQGWFLLKLRYEGSYHYNPTNYHGPLMYFLALIPTLLVGPGEVALRLPSALMGAALPLLLWPVRRELGAVGVLLAGLLLVVAPAEVHYSRSFIQEIQLVFFTLLWAVALLRFFTTPSAAWSRTAALAAVGAFASKETAVLTTVCLVTGGAAAWLVGRPTGEDDLFGGRARGEVVGWARRVLKGHGEVGLLLFVGLLLLLYSSFLTFPMGAVRFFAGFVPWLEYGVTGRNQGQPPQFFWELLAVTVGPLRLLLGPALLLALVRRSRVGLAVTTWAAASFVLYSVIPYKTPWCVLQIDLPLLLSIGWMAGEATRVLRSRAAASVVVVALALPVALPAGGLLGRSVDDVRGGWEYRDRPYVYVQASTRVFDLVTDLAGLAAVDPEAEERGLALLHVWPKHPVRWYTMTRGLEGPRTVRRHADPTPEEIAAADLVLVRTGAFQHDPLPGAWHGQEYRIRGGRRATLWVRQELWDRYQAAGGATLRPWPVGPLRPPRRPDLSESRRVQ